MQRLCAERQAQRFGGQRGISVEVQGDADVAERQAFNALETVTSVVAQNRITIRRLLDGACRTRRVEHRRVQSGAAVQRIVAGAAHQHVVTRRTFERVVADAAPKDVRSLVAQQHIGVVGTLRVLDHCAGRNGHCRRVTHIHRRARDGATGRDGRADIAASAGVQVQNHTVRNAARVQQVDAGRIPDGAKAALKRCFRQVVHRVRGILVGGAVQVLQGGDVQRHRLGRVQRHHAGRRARNRRIAHHGVGNDVLL